MSSLYHAVASDTETAQLPQPGGNVAETADGNPVAATGDDLPDVEGSENQRECVSPAPSDSSSDEAECADEGPTEGPTVDTGRHPDAATGVRRHWVPEVLRRLQVRFVLRARIRRWLIVLRVCIRQWVQKLPYAYLWRCLILALTGFLIHEARATVKIQSLVVVIAILQWIDLVCGLNDALDHAMGRTIVFRYQKPIPAICPVEISVGLPTLECKTTTGGPYRQRKRLAEISAAVRKYLRRRKIYERSRTDGTRKDTKAE
jgi:hypothetical protein